MPHRLTVGHDTLDVGILVRIQVRQPMKNHPFQGGFLLAEKLLLSSEESDSNRAGCYKRFDRSAVSLKK